MPLGTPCPSCGEYDLKIIVHPDGLDLDPGGNSEDAELATSHAYCTNCDWGLCEVCA